MEITSHELLFNNRPSRLVLAHDVTARNRVEERNREEAELLDKARDSIFVSDIEGGIRYWNKSAEGLYGWSAEEVLGQNAFTLFSVAEGTSIADVIPTILRSKSWTGELKQRKKNGQELLAECRLTLVQDAAGNPKTILFIVTA